MIIQYDIEYENTRGRNNTFITVQKTIDDKPIYAYCENYRCGAKWKVGEFDYNKDTNEFTDYKY